MVEKHGHEAWDEMEDGYSMFDYNINVNDVIQLMVKPVLSETNINTSIKAVSKKVLEGKENNEINAETNLKKMADYQGDQACLLKIYQPLKMF
ncbi:hypothetical protein E2C01_040838 [Portunus trituberculatus]|uniref:Uncharacterized protein n=1 Tax=Portunus trituberculatus TaxID=210409 RepID=A0A5B7FPV0_PORTR|nr:hypothetical protein [Portunus trituberculatus]